MATDTKFKHAHLERKKYKMKILKLDHIIFFSSKKFLSNVLSESYQCSASNMHVRFKPEWITNPTLYITTTTRLNNQSTKAFTLVGI